MFGTHSKPEETALVSTAVKRSKRVQVSLPLHVYEVVERTAELSGKSRSAVVSELMETCYEPMCRVLAILEAAAVAPETFKQGLRDVFGDMEKELEIIAGINTREVDRVYGEMQNHLDFGENDPLPTNRGVKNSNSLKNNKKKIPAKKGKK